MRWSTYLSPTDSWEHVGLFHDGMIRGLRGPGNLIGLLGDDGQRLAAAQRPGHEGSPGSAAPCPPSGSGRRCRGRPRSGTSWPSRTTSGPAPPPSAMRSTRSGMRSRCSISPTRPRCAARMTTCPSRPAHSVSTTNWRSRPSLGRGGSDLDPAVAEQHIAGYLVMSDWSARDLQGQEMKGLLGPAKGKDTATSFSAALVTPDESRLTGRARPTTWR